jgi:hypothetical protein
MDDVETPIERPDVIVPDTGPLIHLAQTDALYLLHQIGGRVVVADMVAFEATQDMTKPGAQEIQDWLDAGQKPNSNAPVLVAPTEIGRLFVTARTVDPTARARDAGELAIMQWLGNYVNYNSDVSILIVYENGKIPRFVRETGLDMAKRTCGGASLTWPPPPIPKSLPCRSGSRSRIAPPDHRLSPRSLAGGTPT